MSSLVSKTTERILEESRSLRQGVDTQREGFRAKLEAAEGLPEGFAADAIAQEARLSKLQQAMEAKLREAELAYELELQDDAEPKARKVGLIDNATQIVEQARDAMRATLGEEALALYGLAGYVPRRSARAMIHYIEDSLVVFDQRPVEQEGAFGQVLSTARIADALRDLLDPLREAAQDVEREKREAIETREARDAARDTLHRLRRGFALIAQGHRVLADAEDLIDELRPARRRHKDTSKRLQEDADGDAS